MPVWKFRTSEEARAALWSSPDDPRLPERIRRWWRHCARLQRVIAPRGVRRFATIEEANAERAMWQRVTLPAGEVHEP